MAVAVINHDTRDLLRACLASVRRQEAPEVVVVDNASSDGSAEMVATEFPEARLIVNRRNVGYGTAANEAVARCTTPYVLLLNSDTCLDPGVLPALAAYLDEHPRAAIVGPRLVHPDGRLQPSCYAFPTPLALVLGNSVAGRLARPVAWLRERHLRVWSHAHARVVPWVLGAALGIRREAFEQVGGFDPSFFLYCEETDLCRRLAARGWQTHFAPVATVMHVGGASTSRRRGAMRVELFRGLRRFHARHGSRGARAALTVLVTALGAGMGLVASARGLTGREPAARARDREDAASWWRVVREQWRCPPL